MIFNYIFHPILQFCALIFSTLLYIVGWKIILNSTRFIWKIRYQFIFKILHSFYEIICFITNYNPIIYISHIGPMQVFIGYVIEHFAQGTVLFLNLSDVMNSNIPFIPFSSEYMRKSTRSIMSF